jgi:profilin
MSWQVYVDSNLVGTKKVSKAAIHGLDGNPWATSKGFTVSILFVTKKTLNSLKVTPAEAKTLIGGYKDPSAIRANGLNIAGTRYIVLRTDDRSIYAKKVCS